MDAAEVSLIAVGVSVMSLLSALILGLWLATARRGADVGVQRATVAVACAQTDRQGRFSATAAVHGAAA